MKRITIGKLLGVVGLALFAAGCATAPPKVVDLVWPTPPEEPRIRYLKSYTGDEDFARSKSAAFLETLFGKDSGGRLGKPYAVTTDREGRVYVTDTAVGLVWVFDEKNKKITFLGDSGQGRLRTPVGVAVDSRGVTFVSDSGRNRVFAYDSKGKLAMAIGQRDELPRPVGLAVDHKTDRLYVADSKLHKIRVYNAADGKFLFEVGERGGDLGQFNFPTNLFIRGDKLYVTDTGNFRVQILSLEGKPLKRFGQVGDNFGDFARPRGLAVDSEGHVYVADAAFDNFQILDEEGQLLLFIGSKGVEPGYFWIPAGMHIDEEDRVYVVDSFNFRVQVFQYLGEKYKAKAARKP